MRVMTSQNLATPDNGENGFSTKIAPHAKACWESHRTKLFILSWKGRTVLTTSSHAIVRHISKDIWDRTSAGPFFGQSKISQHGLVWDTTFVSNEFAGCYTGCCAVTYHLQALCHGPPTSRLPSGAFVYFQCNSNIKLI